IPAVPVLVFSVVMAFSFLMSLPGVGIRAVTGLIGGVPAGTVTAACAGGVDHQRCGVDFAVNLEVQVEQVAALGGCGGLEHDFRTCGFAGLRLVPCGWTCR